MDWLSWGADAALQAAIDGVVSYWCARGVSRIAAANLGATLRQWWWHARRNALRGLGYDPDRSLIEWEHEIPLWSRFTWEGEGSVRWVCQRCHAAKTAAEARQRIRARREAKA